MRNLIIGAALLAAAGSAHAEYKDVIAFQMTGECSVAKYMEIVADFNEWAAPRGYQAQVFMPLDSDDLQTYYWVGTSADTETFGKAHDAWLAGVMSGDSGPAELNERFTECSTNLNRQSFYAF